MSNANKENRVGDSFPSGLGNVVTYLSYLWAAGQFFNPGFPDQEGIAFHNS